MPDRRQVLRGLAPLGIIALLDLTTSALPSRIDVFGPLPELPLAVRVVELALALALLPLLPSAARVVRACVDRLPIPTSGKLLLGLYLAGALAAVLLREEIYPFSNVGMFSAVPPPTDFDRPRRAPTIAFEGPAGQVPLSLLREGSSAAATLETGWDYKAGWVMYMYGTAHSKALGHADALARAHGFDRAVRVRAVFDPRTGETLRLDPMGRRRR